MWHSCGNIYALLDKFVEWGFDGLITMEPTAGMDLGKVREQVGHKLALVGNLDVSYLLVRGTSGGSGGCCQEGDKGCRQRGRLHFIGGSFPSVGGPDQTEMDD